MALLTSDQIARMSVGMLTRAIVLPATVQRVTRTDFVPGAGDTISFRVQAPGTARTQASRGATITYDDISETSVPITLAHLYHAKRVSDEELTFDIVDFGAQITSVQVDAVARGAEDELADVMNALAVDDSFALTGSDEDTENMIIAAGEALDTANVPAGDRFLAVSPTIKSRLIKLLDNVSTSGDDSSLRRATVGETYGFTVVASNALTAGTAIAYHRTGFAFGNVVPERPRGATDSATATLGGIGLRHIFQYQPDILSDASVVSTFAGAAVVDAARVYKMDTAAA